MRVLIISDAHIGLGDIPKSQTIVDKIEAILEKGDYDKIVFAGDMLEGWRYEDLAWKVQNRAKKLKEIIKQYPNLLGVLRHPNVQIIAGNHDMAFEKLEGFLDKTILREGRLTFKGVKTNVYIIHGNDSAEETSYDFIASQTSWKAIFFVWLSSIVGKFIGKHVDGISMGDVEQTFNKIYCSVKDGDNALTEYAQAYLDYADENSNPGTDNYLVAGHTHKQLAFGNYYNTGRCTAESIDGVEVYFHEETKRFDIRNVKDVK